MDLSLQVDNELNEFVDGKGGSGNVQIKIKIYFPLIKLINSSDWQNIFVNANTIEIINYTRKTETERIYAILIHEKANQNSFRAVYELCSACAIRRVPYRLLVIFSGNGSIYYKITLQQYINLTNTHFEYYLA